MKNHAWLSPVSFVWAENVIERGGQIVNDDLTTDTLPLQDTVNTGRCTVDSHPGSCPRGETSS